MNLALVSVKNDEVIPFDSYEPSISSRSPVSFSIKRPNANKVFYF